MYNAAIKSGAQADYVDYRETSLEGYDGLLIPGGFSFGDYLRSGAMASVAPIINEVKRLANDGKPVLVYVTDSKFSLRLVYYLVHYFIMILIYLLAEMKI